MVSQLTDIDVGQFDQDWDYACWKAND